mmetsp:Transcript_7093/g.19844  ORF Transcript_7093/g.19844 Transcript_7093/m.19844 type:complete len:287 (+) Transcript_7093:251-1111(+)
MLSAITSPPERAATTTTTTTMPIHLRHNDDEEKEEDEPSTTPTSPSSSTLMSNSHSPLSAVASSSSTTTTTTTNKQQQTTTTTSKPMVRHGRDRKRRSGRKVTLKTFRTWKRWDPKPKNMDRRVRKHWDTSLSPSANLTRLGLSALPNDLHGSQQSSTTVTPTTKTAVELFDIPESDRPTRRSRFPLDLREERYIQKCLAKHGDDYVKMFFDIKGVNRYQWTQHKLRKMGARYLLLTPAQRRLKIPDTVRHLLPEDYGSKQQSSAAPQRQPKQQSSSSSSENEVEE